MKVELNRIKEVLESKGITQSHIARTLKTSTNSINDLVNNRAQPSLERLYMIAQIIDCDVCDLLVKENPYKEESLYNEVIEKQRLMNERRRKSKTKNKAKND